jgi:DNA-directed RNA polymerase subunit RPC12/RpoP
MEKRSLDSLVKGSNACVKCGSEIPFDEIGHNCEIIECPKCRAKK